MGDISDINDNDDNKVMIAMVITMIIMIMMIVMMMIMIMIVMTMIMIRDIQPQRTPCCKWVLLIYLICLIFLMNSTSVLLLHLKITSNAQYF